MARVLVPSQKEVWFSHNAKRYKVAEIPTKVHVEDQILDQIKKKLTVLQEEEEETWNYDKCSISIERTAKDGKLMVVVRSIHERESKVMKNKVKLRYMLGFEVSKFFSKDKRARDKPWDEYYTAYENKRNEKTGERKEWQRERLPEWHSGKRWVFQLGTEENHDYWIWEWAEEGCDIESSTIYRIYQSINDELTKPTKSLSNNTFDLELEEKSDESDDVIPVIYQPAVDSLDNFVREVHCTKPAKSEDGSYEVEVTIIFNNEDLRNHYYLNEIYEFIRNLKYGRKMDIESFKIKIKKDVSNNKFIFENIYSGDSQLEADTIHGDPPPPPIPEHGIKYYFNNDNHPVVFINTSNHAMAEHDTNNSFWKFEYLPWLKENPPIEFGHDTKEMIDQRFKPILPINKRVLTRLKKFME